MSSLRCMLLAVLLAAMAGVGVAQTQGQVAAVRATVGFVYGDVQVRHGGADWCPARVGEALVPGDALKTGVKSRSQLNLGKGNSVRLEQKTQVVITKLQGGGAARIKALVGGLWVTLSKAFGQAGGIEVEMPGVVAATRSTIFRCQVAEDGSNYTYVYEGRVAVQSDQGEVLVTPARVAKVPAGLRPLLDRTDEEQDETDDWVIYNRQRDVLLQLGNPMVLVALARQTADGWRPALMASEAVQKDLERRGLDVRLLTPEEQQTVTYDERGRAQGVAEGAADYLITGPANWRQQDLDADNRRVIVALKSLLLARPDLRLLQEVTADFTLDVPRRLTDEQVERMMANTAGPLLGEDLGPRIVRELMLDKPGMIRVDMHNVTNRRQVAALRELLAGAEGVERAAPLPAYGGRISLAVAGGLETETVARLLQEKASHLVERIVTTRQVVTLRFRDDAQVPEQ